MCFPIVSFAPFHFRLAPFIWMTRHSTSLCQAVLNMQQPQRWSFPSSQPLPLHQYLPRFLFLPFFPFFFLPCSLLHRELASDCRSPRKYRPCQRTHWICCSADPLEAGWGWQWDGGREVGNGSGGRGERVNAWGGPASASGESDWKQYSKISIGTDTVEMDSPPLPVTKNREEGKMHVALFAPLSRMCEST